MLTRMSGVLGAMLAVALVVISLWGWGAARNLVQNADQPELALWAVRSAAVAAFAAAQVLGLTFVAGIFYRRDRISEFLGLAAGCVCALALVSAMALGFVSR